MKQSIINETFHKYFDPIVEQNGPKIKIRHWIEGTLLANSPQEPILISGPLGVGKTRLLKAAGNIVKELFPARKDNMFFMEKGSHLGTPTAFMDDYATNAVHDRDGFLMVDEFGDTEKTTQMKLRDFFSPDIKGSIVEVKHGDAIVQVDPRRWTAAFATNEVDKVLPALMTRIKPVQLETYTEDGMATILFNGAEEIGLKFNEDSLRPLAAASRGTARDIVHILHDLQRIVAMKGKDAQWANKEDVDKLLKIRGMFPLGLNFKEVNTLVLLEDGPKQLQALAAQNGLDSAGQKLLDMYLMAKELLVVNSKRELTSLGREYVKEIRRRHFIGAKKPAMTTF